MIIYKITNKLNGKRYIGQTRRPLESRWREHKSNGKCAISQAIRKYGKENFEIKILARCNNMNEMNHREQYFIRLFNTLAPNGYNLIADHIPSSHSPETRKRISEKLKGRKHSANRIGNGPFKGKKHSEETKKLMAEKKIGKSSWNKGVPASKETREKMRQAKLRPTQENQNVNY